MIKADLIIKGENIVFENGMARGAIAIKAGKIVGVSSDAQWFDANEIFDAKDLVVLPGLVDTHAHMWDPHPVTEREDWYTGTQTAASGGITTVIEMAQSVPPVTNRESFLFKKNIAKSKSVVDFALWGGVTGGLKPDFKGMIEEGCTGIKSFTAWFGSEYASLSDYELLTYMQELAELNCFMGIHCENTNIADGYQNKLIEQGNFTGKAHELSRPEIGELEAISRVLLFAKHTKCKVVILHLSTPKAFEIVRKAKHDGVEVYVETCPHYLSMNLDDLERLHGMAKCAPPIRSEECRLGLWEMLKKGYINSIGSDHFPFLDEDRTKHGNNIFAMPSGMVGYDTVLPIMIDEGIHRQNISYELLAEICATNPAKIHGIYPQKGSIHIGADADFAIVDPNETWTYTYKNAFIKAKMKQGPHEGKKFKGKVKYTYIRGNLVYKDNEILKEAGFGEFVRPN